VPRFRNCFLTIMAFLAVIFGEHIAGAQNTDRPDWLDDPRVIDAMEYCKVEVDNLHVGMRTLPFTMRPFVEEDYEAQLFTNLHSLVNMEKALPPTIRQQITANRDMLIRNMPDYDKRIDEVLQNRGNPNAYHVQRYADKLQICVDNFTLEERYISGAAKAKAYYKKKYR
jgi:hypothetical protein